MRHTRAVLIAAIAMVGLTPAALVAPAAARPAPRHSSPLATAKRLVTQYVTLVKRKDVAGLRRFISPAFLLQRADGSWQTKGQFLDNLPDVHSFSLAKFAARQTGPVLVVRYLATVTGTVNGKPYTPGPAPRLSVFVSNGRAWQIVAHSNFNPLTG
jgi:Domain of unknown function (DUF4440)